MTNRRVPATSSRYDHAAGRAAMFHTYVVSSSGNTVDIDRASFLMDRDLFAQALAHRTEGAQKVWEVYCALHRTTYDAPFEPDCDPFWDRNLSEAEKQAALRAGGKDNPDC
jgi:hypothetical protein